MKEYTIGIDLGGTRVKLGLVREGRVVRYRVVAVDSAGGLREILGMLEREIEGLIREERHAYDGGPGDETADSRGDATGDLPRDETADSRGDATADLPRDATADLLHDGTIEIQRGRLAGIGIAFAGLADPLSKRILSTNKKYDDAKEIDLDNWVKTRWGVPFFIDNDARMAAVGEWKYGAGRDVDDLVMMTIGTGIGTSAIIGGRILRGKHFQAGCLGGHFTVDYNGRVCTCGNVGCVEAYGGTWSLKDNSAWPGFAELFAAIDAGDASARKTFDSYMDVWAAGIVNLIHAYDPAVVVVGGGVMERAADILPGLTERVHRLAWTPWGRVDIRAGALSIDAAILGVTYSLCNQTMINGPLSM